MTLNKRRHIMYSSESFSHGYLKGVVVIIRDYNAEPIAQSSAHLRRCSPQGRFNEGFIYVIIRRI